MGEKYFRFSTISAAGSPVSRDPSTGRIETYRRVARSIPAPTTAMWLYAAHRPRRAGFGILTPRWRCSTSNTVAICATRCIRRLRNRARYYKPPGRLDWMRWETNLVSRIIPWFSLCLIFYSFSYYNFNLIFSNVTRKWTGTINVYEISTFSWNTRYELGRMERNV